MLVKTFGKFFLTNAVRQRLFAWRTKVGEIDPRWRQKGIFEIERIHVQFVQNIENRGSELLYCNILRVKKSQKIKVKLGHNFCQISIY